MDTKKIQSRPVDYRPDEKFIEYGPEALTGAELLAIILRTGSSGMPSVELAENILLNRRENREDVLEILRVDFEDLVKIRGIGKVKALQIKAVAELSRRIATSSRRSSLSFNNPDTIADYYMESMRHLEREEVLLIMLDSSCGLIKDVVLTKGTVNASLFSPREIFIEALKYQAVNIILLHNHPSGNTVPSRADIDGTKNVYTMGQILGIHLLDHIIIGDRVYLSMNKEGLINE